MFQNEEGETLKKLYEIDKLEVLKNIQYVSETIIRRLYSTFDSIEQESEFVEEKAYEKSYQFFDPETMDETHGKEEAYHERVSYYLIHNEMKNEFLNSSITWIFHLFEKDCNRIFGTPNGNSKEAILQRLGINTSVNSVWSKCNSELRLIANTIKHGKGGSSAKLKLSKPNLFKQGLIGASDCEIQLTISDVKSYLNALTEFWGLFFNLALLKQ